MFAQRVTQQSLRRLATGKPSVLSQMAFKQFAAPAAIGSSIQIRPVTTQKMTPADSNEILAAQRKKRPTSPALSIYRPQVTWILSPLHRITGGILSGGLYIFGTAYLVGPLFGWHLDSTSMVAAFGAWPVLAKVATKAAIAFPFTFHSFNGLRHLSWDLRKGFANQQVIQTGWTVVGLSAITTLALATLV